MKKREKPEPGIHLSPREERIDGIISILAIGDDVPILNDDATELKLYNGPRGSHRRYRWDEPSKTWRLLPKGD